MKSRSRTKTRRVVEKLVRASFARTNKARVNYLIDLVAEEGLSNEWLDSLLHLLNEVALGRGPLDRRLKAWMKKTVRYRLLSS